MQAANCMDDETLPNNATNHTVAALKGGAGLIPATGGVALGGVAMGSRLHFTHFRVNIVSPAGNSLAI